MDGLGFAPYEITEMHREAGVLLQVDFLFVRKSHPFLATCQEAIDRLGDDGAAWTHQEQEQAPNRAEIDTIL